MALGDFILPHYTYDDLQNWKGRWEIIRGIPFAMSPSPSVSHQEAVSNLHYWLRHWSRNQECSLQILDFLDVMITEDTVLQPDIIINCNRSEERPLRSAPVLVFEVLSPSTRLKDQNTKRSLYESFGVKYYLMVDIEQKSITTLHLENGVYVEDESSTLHLCEHCDLSVDWSLIW